MCLSDFIFDETDNEEDKPEDNSNELKTYGKTEM